MNTADSEILKNTKIQHFAKNSNDDEIRFMIVYTIVELEDKNCRFGIHKFARIMKESLNDTTIFGLRYGGKLSHMKIDDIKLLINNLIKNNLLEKKTIKDDIYVIQSTDAAKNFGANYIHAMQKNEVRDPIDIVNVNSPIPDFSENEQYKHKLAKELLVKWLFDGDYEERNMPYQINDIKSNITFRKNKAFVEYPIVINDKFNSLNNLWDEFYDNYDFVSDFYNLCTPSPTFDWCVDNKLFPMYIFDIAISHKGSIAYGIEIVNTHKVDADKRDKIQDSLQDTVHANIEVLEISAEWILKQKNKPQCLLLERYINCDDDILSINSAKDKMLLKKDNYVQIDTDEFMKNFSILEYYNKESCNGNEICDHILRTTKKSCGKPVITKYTKCDDTIIYRCKIHTTAFDKINMNSNENNDGKLLIKTFDFLRCEHGKNIIDYIFGISFNDIEILKSLYIKTKHSDYNKNQNELNEKIKAIIHFQIVMRYKDESLFYIDLCGYDIYCKLISYIDILKYVAKSKTTDHNDLSNIMHKICMKIIAIVKCLNTLAKIKNS